MNTIALVPRTPAADSARRIEPLAVLPLFFKLQGRTVIVVGQTEGALWKAELLAAAGADVVMFAGIKAEEAGALARSVAAGSLRVESRAWTEGDLDGAALAVADLEDEPEIALFRSAALARGVPINIVDKPALCTFQFGGIVNRSPLVIGISTDGAAPVFGQAIRTRIEALVPAGLAAWAQAARDWRPAVQARALAFRARRMFWESFTAHAMARPAHAPTESDREALLGQLDGIEAGQGTGRVTLVGAGPGDPELLTLKAVRVLQSADIILYDDLVSPGVLDLARREAKRVQVGKKGHGPSCKQDDINRLIVTLASEGHHVVRLKGGDPGVFGRATEELEACQAAGVPTELIPGITTAQGAAAALGLSLTRRRAAQRLQFITGHADNGALPETLSVAALVDPTATTVVYMPRRTWAQLAGRLVAGGLDPETPALAVSAATRPHQRHVAATVATLGDALAALDPAEPLVVLFGRAMDLAGIAAARDEQETAAPRLAAG